MYINIAVQYARPAQVIYARDTLQAAVREIVESEDLDLEIDPSLVCERVSVFDFYILTPSEL